MQAYETVERGKAEHATLVSATTIHQSAARAAGELREQADAYARGLHEQADDYHQSTIAEADRYAADIRAEAERYAAKLADDSEDYADRTLYELAMTLQRAAHTAEQGRVALAQRRAGQQPAAAGPDEVYDADDAPADPVGRGVRRRARRCSSTSRSTSGRRRPRAPGEPPSDEPAQPAEQAPAATASRARNHGLRPGRAADYEDGRPLGYPERRPHPITAIVGMPENSTPSPRHAPGPDPRSPFVFDVRLLGRRPGAMRTERRQVPAPANLGSELIGVPEGAPLAVDVRLESVTEGVLVTAHVTAPLHGECARCLDPITDELAVDVVELFA